MKPAVEKILREFEKGSEKEWEQMREMEFGRMKRHLGELLLSVGLPQVS